MVNDVMCIQQFSVEQLDDMFYDSCNLFVDRASGLFTNIYLGAIMKGLNKLKKRTFMLRNFIINVRYLSFNVSIH